MIVDLRSDTVTRPTAAMREAMARARVDDDVLGRDPTVRELEARAAELTGKEAALFVPSGTMANSIALGLHTRAGDEAIFEASCHSVLFECGGAARIWGVQSRSLASERGVVPLEAIESAIRPDDIHHPRTSLVVLEQTNNLAGGCVLPLEYLRSVGELCRARGLAFHLDGARIFNAAIATARPVREHAEAADSVMFCVSKGLGAPVGSLLAAGADAIAEGRRLRKLLGGGMRQSGILAAAGLWALDHHVQGLAEDHRRARGLARSLDPLRERGLALEPPETNMLYLDWPGRDPGRHAALVARLRRDGVLAVALPGRGVRLVFHRDVDDEGLERAREVLRARLEALLERR